MNYECARPSDPVNCQETGGINCITLVSFRMTTGRKKPKMPEIEGGKTPEMKAKEYLLASDHDCKKGTYALSCL